MQDNLRRHRPDIMVIGGGKALAIMPEDPMGVWVHIQEVRDLLDVKDRTIHDYEDNYLPRPKTLELKSWEMGSPETGEQWVYDAEEVDRVIAAKDAEIEELKAIRKRLEEANANLEKRNDSIYNEWKALFEKSRVIFEEVQRIAHAR